MTPKFNQIILELNRRGLLKGMAGMLATGASAQGQSYNTRDFVKRVEMLVSYLESGIKPNEPIAKRRNQFINSAERARKNFRGSYHIALGQKNMGEAIFNSSYWELNKTFKGAKGKYQIIPSTFKDLENNGLYNAVPEAQHDFSPMTQDKIFSFMEDKKYNFKKAISEFGAGNVDKAIWYLSREWASIPKDSSNLSYYDHDGRNKALAKYNNVRDFLLGRIGIKQVEKI